MKSESWVYEKIRQNLRFFKMRKFLYSKHFSNRICGIVKIRSGFLWTLILVSIFNSPRQAVTMSLQHTLESDEAPESAWKSSPSQTQMSNLFRHSNSVNMEWNKIFVCGGEGNPCCVDGLSVFLTVSSLAKSVQGVKRDRLIELNWNAAEPIPGDWVGLYDKHPDEYGSNPLTQVAVVMARGFVTSEYRLERKDLEPGQDPCLGYWIAYVRRNRVLLTNCLQTYPSWMTDLRDVIGDMPLHALMIPGTHNSGSWKEYEGPSSDTVFLRFLVCQDESVYHQLMHGIRYLDIRVGYYATSTPTTERFWVNHDFYRMRPLSQLISDVKRFAEETKEIVILDFHRFPVGFDGRRERHEQLVEYLNRELEQYTVPSSFWPNATPNEIWAANRSLIISYADSRTVQQYPNLWPHLPQEWGDKRSLPDLKAFVGEAIKKRGGKGQIWAAMTEFTPKPLDIVLRPNMGLRPMAQSVNIPVTYWFQDKNWYSKSNVIATDFFLGNNVIQMSILSNYKRAKCI